MTPNCHRECSELSESFCTANEKSSSFAGAIQPLKHDYLPLKAHFLSSIRPEFQTGPENRAGVRASSSGHSCRADTSGDSANLLQLGPAARESRLWQLAHRSDSSELRHRTGSGQCRDLPDARARPTCRPRESPWNVECGRRHETECGISRQRNVADLETTECTAAP